MDTKTQKTVLIVDDEPSIRLIVEGRFKRRNKAPNSPYEFLVDTASTTKECIKKIRTRSYDILILDISLAGGREGLDLTLPLSLQEEFGNEMPVRIIFTGYQNEKWHTEAMRHGVWDYIIKEDGRGGGSEMMSEKVVDSAIFRLRQLDLRREQEQRISVEWLPARLEELKANYAGQLVAFWHDPEVKVIATGFDAFDLEDNLKQWRSTHAGWQQPYIKRIASDH